MLFDVCFPLTHAPRAGSPDLRRTWTTRPTGGGSPGGRLPQRGGAGYPQPPGPLRRPAGGPAGRPAPRRRGGHAHPGRPGRRPLRRPGGPAGGVRALLPLPDPAPGRAVPAAGHGPGRQRGRRRGGPPRPRGAGPADRGLPPPAGRAAAPPHGGQRRRPPGGRALPRAAARGRRLPRRQRQPAPRAAPGRPATGPQAGLPGGPEAPAAAPGLDVRRTVRRSLSSGGVPVDPAFRAVRASSPTCTCSPTSPAR